MQVETGTLPVENSPFWCQEMRSPGYIGERVRAVREAKGLTQQQVAAKANVAERTLRMIEQGTSQPRTDTLGLIAAGLGTTVQDLLADGQPPSVRQVAAQTPPGALPIIVAAPLSRMVSIPVLGHVAAGPGVSTASEAKIGEIAIEASKLHGLPAFGLIVKGDSMDKAGIKDGDTVVVSRGFGASPGDIVLVRDGEDATVKRFVMQGDGLYFVPESTNPTHKAFAANPDIHDVVGRVIAVVEKSAPAPIPN